MVLQGRLLSIMNYLRTKRTVSVSELCEALSVSESTVRRDLALLEKRGKLVRVHGGAALTDEPLLNDESDVVTKAEMFVEQKLRIGSYAASLIDDSDIVFIDAGTTTEKLVDAVSADSKAVFVTNGIVHGHKLAQKGLDVTVVCGKIKPKTQAIVGPHTVPFLNRYNFTKSFLGTNGISLSSGFTTPESGEAAIKEAVALHSKQAYILADSSKFSIVSTITFCPISSACILTDEIADTKYLKAAQIKEVP